MMRSEDVPADLWLVESFVNSVDMTSGRDDLVDTSRFAQWLDEHARPTTSGQVSDAHLRQARHLRHHLRKIMASHHDASPRQIDDRDLIESAGPLRARITFDMNGDAIFEPEGRGASQFLAEIATNVALASSDGRWERMKLCVADVCGVGYYDTSKNRSKRWCSMQACGNRQKTRNYYQRHSTTQET